METKDGEEQRLDAEGVSELLWQWKRDCPSCYENWLIRKAASNLTAEEKAALKQVLAREGDGKESSTSQDATIRGLFWEYPLLNGLLGRRRRRKSLERS